MLGPGVDRRRCRRVRRDGELGKTYWHWGAGAPRRGNAVFAPFGAAATAAGILELSREQTTAALGHAAHAGMGLAEGNQGPLHALLTRNGVMAALIVAEGMPSSRTMTEGDHGVFTSFFGEVPDGLDASLSSLVRSSRSPKQRRSATAPAA